MWHQRTRAHAQAPTRPLARTRARTNTRARTGTHARTHTHHVRLHSSSHRHARAPTGAHRRAIALPCRCVVCLSFAAPKAVRAVGLGASLAARSPAAAGPRMTLSLLKIEDGFGSGDVIFHSFGTAAPSPRPILREYSGVPCWMQHSLLHVVA